MSETIDREELLSDIVREMRTHAKDGEFVSGYEVNRIADRIEAAAKTQVVTDNTETLRNALAENARLRDALKDIADIINGDWTTRGERVRMIANAALEGGAE